MSEFRNQAIFNTHSKVITINEHRGAVDQDDNLVTLDETKIAEEIKRLQAEHESTQYQRDRVVSYPSIQDQLDMLYHQGIDGWKAEIKKVKDAHPKPEST